MASEHPIKYAHQNKKEKLAKIKEIAKSIGVKAENMVVFIDRSEDDNFDLMVRDIGGLVEILKVQYDAIQDINHKIQRFNADAEHKRSLERDVERERIERKREEVKARETERIYAQEQAEKIRQQDENPEHPP